MTHNTGFVRLALILALILTALAPASAPLYAQDAALIALDEAGFGVAQMDVLDAGAQAAFTLELAAGDRVAMDLQGENDALQVVAFRADYGDLAMEGIPAAFNYLAWAPEDGVYTVVVENTGDALRMNMDTTKTMMLNQIDAWCSHVQLANSRHRRRFVVTTIAV